MKMKLTVSLLLILLIRLSYAQSFNLIFTQDSADASNPGVYLYSYTPGFLNLDQGNGKKVFLTSNYNEEAHTMTTEYHSGGTLGKVQSIFEKNITGSSNLGTRGRFVQTVNCQITGDDQLEHVIVYGTSGSTPEIGSTYMNVKDSYSGTVIFDGKYQQNAQAYFIADQFRKGKEGFDLNGNNYYEIISYKPFETQFGYRIYVYDNLSLLDSVDDFSAGFINKFGTTNDINNDGKPELFHSADTKMNFFEWDDNTSRFKLIGNIPGAKTMLRDPSDIDGDGKKEIITQAGFWLGDSLYIYDSDFHIKYKLQVPTIASYGIKSYYTANINDSPNDEIILVTTFLNMNDFSQSRGTAVYDLSVNTTAPVYIDSAFEALDIGDFRNDGNLHLLGLKTLKTPNFASIRNNFVMKKFNGSLFEDEFIVSDTTLSYTEITGPLLPSDFIKNTVIGYVPPEIADADMDGDGKFDFIVRTTDNSTRENLYLIINSDGTILDTLQGLYSSSSLAATALSYDFNNNGRAEILLTQNPYSGFLDKPQKVYLYEYEGVTEVKDLSVQPGTFCLKQNYPNPFNPTTVISYSIPVRSLVVIRVYDIVGNEMAVLTNEEKEAGNYQITFDGTGLSSGVYFYRMQAGKFTETKKFILMK